VLLWGSRPVRRQQRDQGRRTNEQTPRRLVVAFFSGFSAGLGGHEGGCNNHSDKGQGDQQIMHYLSSPCVVLSLAPGSLSTSE